MLRALLLGTISSALLGCGGKAPAPALGLPGEPPGPEVAPMPRPAATKKLDANENLPDQIDKAKVDLAAARCATIERAIEAFMLKPQTNGKPPPGLMALVTGFPDTGIQPILDGGEKALLDPWGGKFEFEMVHDGFRDVPKVTAKAPGGRVITSPKWAAKTKK